MPEWTTIHTNRGDYDGLPSATMTGPETLLAQLTITVDSADPQRRAEADQIFKGLRITRAPSEPASQAPQAGSSGVTVRTDVAGRLLDVTISADAHQRGPQESSGLIMDAYRQATVHNSSPDLDLHLPPN